MRVRQVHLLRPCLVVWMLSASGMDRVADAEEQLFQLQETRLVIPQVDY